MTTPIDQQERIRTWFHPLRIKIVELLRARGSMTQTELARAIDANTASARYHLLRLVRAGFVEHAGTRPGPKAITEKLFRHIQQEPTMEPLTFATKHGTAQDREMRRLSLDSVTEIHRVGARIIQREPQRFFGIHTQEITATPEKLRALRDALKATLAGFIAGLEAPGEDEKIERATVCINFYPHSAPAET
ncbi:MAG: helix-turn-helix domain-containing protein [Planctomycetes bacterium]|nr:helix-turn-helix domain-containing protein [Planctomycetota bacterium]